MPVMVHTPPLSWARSLATAVAAALAVLAVLGCGDGRPTRRHVTGTVTIEGRPAAGAVVVLHPQAGAVAAAMAGLRPMGRCDATGRFALGTWESADGVPEGRWRATVAWHGGDGVSDPEAAEAGPDRLAGRYSDPAASPFVVDVAGSAIDLQPFDLRLPPPLVRTHRP